MENYKLIKADLDRLRTLVEKSELWVEKKSSGGGDGKKDKKDKKDKVEVGSSNMVTANLIFKTDVRFAELKKEEFWDFREHGKTDRITKLCFKSWIQQPVECYSCISVSLLMLYEAVRNMNWPMSELMPSPLTYLMKITAARHVLLFQENFTVELMGFLFSTISRSALGRDIVMFLENLMWLDDIKTDKEAVESTASSA